MSDYIVRATAANETVRAFAIDSTEMTATAREKHHTFPVVTAAMGRLMGATAMMGSMMKGEDDKLTVTIKGDGGQPRKRKGFSGESVCGHSAEICGEIGCRRCRGCRYHDRKHGFGIEGAVQWSGGTSDR